MLTLIGSSIIPAIGISSIWLIGYGRWRRTGWYLGLLNQIIWIVYASLTAQYGFIVGALIAGSGHVNALRRQEERPSDDGLLAACEAYIALSTLSDPGEFLRGLDAVDAQIRAAVANARAARAQQCARSGG